MFSVLKKISDFAGTRRGLLKKSMAVAFLGAVFAALQFAALMLTLDILVGGADLRIWPVIGVMVVSVVGRAACFYWSTNAETETGYFMVAEKRIHIGDRLRYIPMGYFNDNSLGNITAVVTTTLSDVENNAARCLVSVIGGFLNTLGLCLGLTVADWRLGLLAIAGILAYLGVTELSQRAMLKTGPARQHAQMNLVEAVLEYIQGMSVVKSYGLDKDSGQAVQRTVDESCDKALSLEKSVVPWMGLRQVVVRVFSVAIAVCALAFYSGGTLSLARCLLMLVASFMLYAELESAGNMADNLQMLGASMDKANSIDDTPVMDIDGAELTPADTSVEFQDVSFAYGDRTILDHVSLTVPSGSITAVVGPSGGGKTTLCNLIARFWDAQSGKITVGGYDVREYKLDSLMKNISMVFQSVYLFNDTVENNIKFGRPDATHEQVVAAARAACCHDFILTLFAIAKELEKSGNISPMVEADLAVGLPPEHYALRQRFADYFKRGRVNFVFNGAPICLMIRHVFVYPQAYAAVVPQAGRLKEIPRTFIIDIGGYTTDVMLLRNAAPDLQFCRSLEMGVIPMSNDIISRVSAMYDIKIEDDHIADIIQGRPTILPQEVREVVFMKVRSYACDILDKLRELQVDLRANPAIFIGGGSILFRSFVEESPLVAHADFVTDPKANAIGYGMLATAQLRRMTPQNHGGEFFAQG